MSGFDEYVRKAGGDSEGCSDVAVLRAAGEAACADGAEARREAAEERAGAVRLQCEVQQVSSETKAYRAKLKRCVDDLNAERRRADAATARAAQLEATVAEMEAKRADIEHRLQAVVAEQVLANEEGSVSPASASPPPPPPQQQPPSSSSASKQQRRPSVQQGGGSGVLNRAYLDIPAVPLALPDHSSMVGEEVLAIIKSALQSVKDLARCLEQSVVERRNLTDRSLAKAQEEAVFLLTLLAQLSAMFAYCYDVALGIGDARPTDRSFVLPPRDRASLLSQTAKLYKAYHPLMCAAKASVGKIRDVMRATGRGGPLSDTSGILRGVVFAAQRRAGGGRGEEVEEWCEDEGGCGGGGGGEAAASLSR
eukprot:Rhum_TRINITY_DN14221_c12_g1::Rhum_TRINITY_DN14221_c12_g1_i1::g.74905::m.74905